MRRFLPVAVLALAAAAPARAAGPFDDLLKHAPANTNTLVLIDVKGAFASPIAKKEQWAQLRDRTNTGGLGFLPADAETVVIASDVNMSSFARGSQIGLVKTRDVPSIKQLAAREQGPIDDIAGRLTVLSPQRNVYFTTLSGYELAAIYPADRQFTSRWVKAARANKLPPLAPYLQKAVDRFATNSLVVALDLEDAVDASILKFGLLTSPAVTKHKGVDINLLAGFLANVKGLTFGAELTSRITGRLTVEFAGDPNTFRKTLPDLVLELLDGQGVWIEGLDTWEVTFTDTAMTLTGPMTTTDLKRVLSLFAFPQAAGEPEEGVKAGDSTVPATKRYLAAVDAVLGDVRKTRESPDYNKTATWHDKAAAQIEQLSRQNVDPLAVDAAMQAAKRLRAIAASLRGVPVNMDALASQSYSYYTPSVSVGISPRGAWGWQPFIGVGSGSTQTNIPEIQSKMAKVIADDKQRRAETWSQIDKVLVEIRKTLSEKYKTGF